MNRKEILEITELADLKSVADSVGLTYSSRIGIEALQNKLIAFYKARARAAKVENEKIKVQEDKPKKKKAKKGKGKGKKKEKSVSPQIIAEQKARFKAKEQAKKKKKKTKKIKAYMSNLVKAEDTLSKNANFFSMIKETDAEKIMRTRKAASAKKRVRVVVYDPHRAKLSGEVLRGRNKYSGSVGQLVLYNEKPQYVPQILLNILAERQYSRTSSEEMPDGSTRNFKTLVPAYYIEYLPDLTKKELGELANAQAAAGLIGN